MAAPRSPFTRGHWFKGLKFDPRVDNILSMTDEKRHEELREKVMPGYSGREVGGLESDIDKRVLELIALIKKYTNKSKSFDFALLAGYFTLDSLTQIAFGQAPGFLTEDKDLYNYIETSTAFFPIIELRSNHPLIPTLLNTRLMQSAAALSPPIRSASAP